jgi:hypothetical protein
MTELAKFVLTLMLVASPFGVAMIIKFIALKDYSFLLVVALFAILTYTLIDSVDSNVTYRSQIKKLEAEITQLKEGNK